MYCPNCGKTNAPEQKFCRSCGLGLEKVIESLVEQLPAAPKDLSLKERQRKIDRWLNIVGTSAISIFVLSVLLGIIFKIIIGKGAFLEGSIFLAIIVGIILFALLALYRDSLSKGSGRRGAQGPSLIKDADTAKLLPDSLNEPLPSVTEHTTELLKAEKIRGKESN